MDLSNSSKKSKIILTLVLLTLVLLSPLLYWDTFNELSATVFADFQFIDKGIKATMLNLIYILTHKMIPYISVVFIYNYCSLSETVNIMLNCYVSCFISGVLVAIYREPRPYLEDLSINPHACVGGWGSPSQMCCNFTVFLLALRKLTTSRKIYENNTAFKTLFSFGISLYLLFIAFFSIFLGLNSLEENLFGISVGFFIHFLLFYAISIPKQNPRLVLWILKTPLIYFTSFLIGSYLVSLLLYFNLADEIPLQWKISSLQECAPEDSCHIQDFDKAALFNYYTFSSFLGLALGLKLDFIANFERNTEIYLNYYFDEPETHNDSLFFKETRWNITGFLTSLVRLLVIVALSMLPTGLFFATIDCHVNTHVYYVITHFLPNFGFNIMLFFVSQRIVPLLHLSNEKSVNEFIF